jgi:hypothetical protein
MVFPHAPAGAFVLMFKGNTNSAAAAFAIVVLFVFDGV